jgi:hypothetical protein
VAVVVLPQMMPPLIIAGLLLAIIIINRQNYIIYPFYILFTKQASKTNVWWVVDLVEARIM